MSPARVFLLAGLVIATFEIGLAALLRGTELAPYFGACAALTVAIAVLARRLLEPRRGDGRDDRRGPPPGDEPPPWWPEFEAQLRTWERERARAPVDSPRGR